MCTTNLPVTSVDKVVESVASVEEMVASATSVEASMEEVLVASVLSINQFHCQNL